MSTWRGGVCAKCSNGDLVRGVLVGGGYGGRGTAASVRSAAARQRSLISSGWLLGRFNRAIDKCADATGVQYSVQYAQNL